MKEKWRSKVIDKFKYAIKKMIIKSKLSLKNYLQIERMRNMSKQKKIMVCLKKIVFHPIKAFSIFKKGDFNIEYIEMVLTTKCTLKCVGCSALMCYYKKQNDILLENNIKALERIVNACDSLFCLRLLGGEPLCYQNLYDILLFIKNKDKIKKVTIVTNGTLTINDNRIIEILKEDKFDVYISDYGKISRKKDGLIQQLEKNNIKYYSSKIDTKWRDYGNLECRNRTEKELKKQFLNCNIMCTSILNGKLHHCPRSSHGTNLNKIPLKDVDYIDLLDNNIDDCELRKRLFEFFYGYIPYIEACNYCNSGTSELKYMKAGEQMKK